jgi:hypothetical protein
MTSLDPDIEPLIDALRSDLPEPREAARLRARLTAAGVIAGGVVAAPSTAAGASGLSALGGQAGVISKAAAVLGGSKVLLAAVVLTGSAVPMTVYLASSSTEKAESRVVARDLEAFERQVALPGATGSAPRTVATAERPVATPSKREPARPEATGVARGEPPIALPPAPLPAKPRAPGPRALAEPANERRSEAEAPASAVATFAALERAPAESTLREETELMDRALSALRSGSHEAARRLLGEHAARFPKGALAPERERALERLKQAELSDARAGER